MKKIFLGIFTILVVCVIGCGGAALLDAPVITSVIMGSTSVTVTWLKDTIVVNHADFQGWNIYVYTDSSELLIEDGEDLNKFNSQIITNITTAISVSYTVDGLSQDSIYYIQVRTVNIDNEVGSYNADLPFVIASPRPEFTATVRFEMNTPGVDDSCAIRFSDAMIMADSAMASDGADMWVDVFPISTEDTVAFDSPSHSTQWGTGARVSKFLNLGQHELDDITEVTSEPTITTYVPINEGDLIIVKTADNHYVKVHVDAIDKIENQVTVTYAYQNIADFPYFSP
jgi:hypothetical protein